MEQQTQPASFVERRRDPREPKAFAFWIRRLDTMRRTSAWMLDMSIGGAAFLVDAVDAPPVGERIELLEMLTADREVREGSLPLPRFARILRHDEAQGITTKIAAQFESDANVPLGEMMARRAAAFRLKTRIAPIAPPSPIGTPPNTLRSARR